MTKGWLRRTGYTMRSPAAENSARSSGLTVKESEAEPPAAALTRSKPNTARHGANVWSWA